MDEEKKEKKVFFVTPSEGDESINDGQQRLPQINQPTTVQVKRQKRLSIVWPIVIVAAGVLIYYLVLLNLNSQPKPLTKKKEVKYLQLHITIFDSKTTKNIIPYRAPIRIDLLPSEPKAFA